MKVNYRNQHKLKQNGTGYENPFFLIILILFLVSACIGTIPVNPDLMKSSLTAQLPSWYTDPPLDSPTHWVGIGSAFIQADAEKHALSSIAARINTTLKSSFKQQMHSSTFQSEEQIQEYTTLDVATTTGEMNFTGYTVKKSKRVSNQYYVLVEVDKATFFKNYQNRLQLLNQELESIVSTAQNSQAILARLKTMQTIKPKVAEAEKIAILLNAYSKLPNSSHHFSNYVNLRKEESQIRSRIKFHIQYDQKMKLIAESLKEQLGKENIRVVTKADRNDSNAAHIFIQGTDKPVKVYGTFITKLFVTLKVSANKQIISNEQLEFSGSSVRDALSALRVAASKFTEHVKKNGALKTLGLTSE